MQLRIIREILLKALIASSSFDSSVFPVYNTHDRGFFGVGAEDGGCEEARRGFEPVEDARAEVGVFEAALSETGVCELQEDGVLAAEKEDGFSDEGAEESGLRDGFVDGYGGDVVEFGVAAPLGEFACCWAGHGWGGGEGWKMRWTLFGEVSVELREIWNGDKSTVDFRRGPIR